MRLQIQGAGSNQFTMQQGVLDGLLVSFKATTVTDITAAVMQSVNITVTLQSSSGNETILSGNLFALGVANNPSSYEGLAIGLYKSFDVKFGGFIQVKDGDNLQVSVSVGTAVTGGVVTVTSADGVGIEEYTPKVIVFSVDKTRSNYAITPGNNISKVGFVNTTTDFTLTSIDFSSNYFNTNLLVDDFYALMAAEWERTPENYSFTFFNGGPVDNMNINLNVNTSATSNGYIVAYAGIVTPRTRERTAKAVTKLAAQAEAKFGV